MNPSLRIGELARKSGCPADTIRFYEREGLLPVPVRTAGNYRLYGPAHAARLVFIRNCRLLDMTLDEIRELLSVRDLATQDCTAAHRLIDDHMAHVADRIAELHLLEKQLKSLRRNCSEGRRNGPCAILDDLGRPRLEPGPRSRAQHVKGPHR